MSVILRERLGLQASSRRFYPWSTDPFRPISTSMNLIPGVRFPSIPHMYITDTEISSLGQWTSSCTPGTYCVARVSKGEDQRQ